MQGIRRIEEREPNARVHAKGTHGLPFVEVIVVALGGSGPSAAANARPLLEEMVGALAGLRGPIDLFGRQERDIDLFPRPAVKTFRHLQVAIRKDLRLEGKTVTEIRATPAAPLRT